MECWLLDDAHYPTGTANGLLKDKYPHLGRHAIREAYMDLMGPARDTGVLIGPLLPDDAVLVGIVACRRYDDRPDHRLTGEAFDLECAISNFSVVTDRVEQAATVGCSSPYTFNRMSSAA